MIGNSAGAAAFRTGRFSSARCAGISDVALRERAGSSRTVITRRRDLRGSFSGLLIFTCLIVVRHVASRIFRA
jgi:hypothetical protein